MNQPINGENWKQAEIISSFDQKPANGGIPAIAKQPMRKQMLVIGMYLCKPPMYSLKLLPMMTMMAPEQRKSNALNIAWVKRWKIPAM